MNAVEEQANGMSLSAETSRTATMGRFAHHSNVKCVVL